ncbi:MAG: hypothetical protein GTO40_19125 [Deltaproteobacteria bacterium]|nr:hypothetical protein [Deltaproteobacteria bacterium]
MEQTTETAIFSSLNTRIDRLERQSRSMKRLAAMLFFVIIALGVTAIAVPRKVSRVLESERFILRDSDGRMRAYLGFTRKGIPALKMFDVNGNAAFILGVISDGSPVMTFQKNGTPRALLSGTGKNPSFTLHDYKGNVRAMLDLESKSGEPSLRLFSENGRLLTLGRSDLVLYEGDGEIIWGARQIQPIGNIEPKP